MHILNLQRRGMPSFLKRVTFVVSSPIIVGYDRSEFRVADGLGRQVQEVRMHDQLPRHRPSDRTLSQTMPIRRLMRVSL